MRNIKIREQNVEYKEGKGSERSGQRMFSDNYARCLVFIHPHFSQFHQVFHTHSWVTKTIMGVRRGRGQLPPPVSRSLRFFENMFSNFHHIQDEKAQEISENRRILAKIEDFFLLFCFSQKFLISCPYFWFLVLSLFFSSFLSSAFFIET